MELTGKALFIALCAGLGGCGDAPEPELGGHADGSIVSPAEATRVLDLDGASVDPLAANERADVFLFLRTDCPISNRYAPKLGRIAAQFETQPADLWLVYVDPDETPELIRRHIADYQLPGTPLRDPDQLLAARAGIEVTPEAAVFDATGQRRYHGRIDNWYADYGKARVEASTHELIDALVAVLDGRSPAVSVAAAVGCPLPPRRARTHPRPRMGPS